MLRRRRNQDLEDELKAHLAMAIEDRIARGETPEEAAINARREFGNPTLIKETTRDTWRWHPVDRIEQNVRLSIRQLQRDKSFSSVAILTLSIGLAAVATLFSIVDGVLLKPLQYRDSDRLYVARTVPPPSANIDGDFPVNARHSQEWRMRCRSCADIALVSFDELTLVGAGDAVRLPAFRVTPNFFETLGVRPALGRDFTDVDDMGSVILTHSFWRSRFGADRGIVGRTIQLNGESHSVIGVMPASLSLPKGDEWGTIFGPNEEPAAFRSAGLSFNRVPVKGAYGWNCVIRLKHGVAPEAAAAEMNSLSAGLLQPLPLENRTRLTPLHWQVTRNVRAGLWMLLCAVGAVLLIVCLNVGNLMLIRTASRSREAGVRIALGATRWQLLSLVFTEAMVIMFVSGALAFVLTTNAVSAFTTYAPASIPRSAEVQMDWRVFIFSAASALLAALLCCLAPAWKLVRTEPIESLKSGAASVTESSRKLHLREWTVGLEVALSTVLLMIAGLLIASFLRVVQADKGLDVAHVVTQDVSFLSPKYARGARRAVVEDLQAKLAAIPGVTAIGAVNHLPLIGEDWVGDLVDSDSRAPAKQAPAANFRFVTPGYFQAMGIRLKSGRLLTESDKNQPRALIGEQAARHLWPGQDPIGRHVRGMGPGQPALEVVGVVSEVPAGPIDQAMTLTVYEHYWRMQPVGMSFALRTPSDPTTVTTAIAKVLSVADPEMAIQPAVTMKQIIDNSVAGRRLETAIASIFAATALMLALLGIYGVVSFAIARRTVEIGIRMALGAERRNVLAMVIHNGMRPVVSGLAVGLPAGLLINRAIVNRLYQVAPHDPFVIALVIASMVVVAMAACYIPAARASRIDPVTALRFE